jgi:hypothetical protein
MTKFWLEIYPISFVLHFNLVNYITRCIWMIENTHYEWAYLKGLILKAEPKIK